MLNLNHLEFHNKHVVIVEDDIPSVKYYETILKNTGAVVTILKNGRDFTEFLKLNVAEVDFLIVDFLVPFINGVDCIRAFRRKNKTVPVVMITAFLSEQIRNEALIAGCNEYILKPVFPEKLVMILEKYLLRNKYVTI
jgi:DNA-binding response OmpR family regulator